MIDVLQVEQRLAERRAKIDRVNRDGWRRHTVARKREWLRFSLPTPVMHVMHRWVAGGVRHRPPILHAKRHPW